MKNNQTNQIKKRKLPYQIDKFKVQKFHHFQPNPITNSIEPLLDGSNNNKNNNYKKLKKMNYISTTTITTTNNIDLNNLLPIENIKQLFNQLNSNREIMDTLFNQFLQLYNSINFQSPLSNLSLLPITNYSNNDNDYNSNNIISTNIEGNNNNKSFILPNLNEDLFLNIPDSLKDLTNEKSIQENITLPTLENDLHSPLNLIQQFDQIINK
ncbi:hypothetical protein DDB_G0280241 [Dictyostelium discoideum AX4]|uniref:Putative uncharacterized protein DDB_G0280241 n=1 Tax=Dictyostelium discoideum TaxID=44689 RepID=Y6463_DICDI|nr:hypothetical protein DDB_G0280241 [Dictyostelium discoideum AX4]Q54VN0.1 RecName: Full=Putative uncharacterized protein DDB_G0280241 [Dictyostelium discoideum]EAL67347.1 hypothetical protein DDB_G0280241 [Dictyostelium discoideum AX4]|eukprot:XP_641325.1 hypothetical protein DDB_G0280241 [Dictyostelium discoideum AX4]